MEFKGTKGSWILKPKINRIIVGESIADVWGFDAHIDDKSNREMKANALLISKAPEMLEMLKSFVNDFDNGLIEDYQIPRDRFEQLIKQATEL